MPSTAYERGRNFEYRVQNFFRKLGYVVTRSPKSKSPVDLFVIGHQIVLFVQCKVDGYLPPIEWNALLDMCAICGALPVLAARNGRKLELYRLLAAKDRRGPQPRIRLLALVNEKSRAAA
jgi:Holliday junction resolvase